MRTTRKPEDNLSRKTLELSRGKGNGLKRHLRFGATAIFCLSACMIGALARAEEPATHLGEVVVTEGKPQGSSKEDASAFVSVIRPELFKGEYTSTAELLDHAVGVHVVDFGGLGQRQTVSVRGSSAEQVVVLLDGVRLNSAQRGGVDIASIPLEIIERIEVMRGGEAALYGTDAVGGVVNIITKKGVANAPGTTPWKPNINASGTFGSFETYEATGSVGGKVANFDYFLSHTHFNTQGDFPFLDTNDHEQTRINNKSHTEAPFVRLGMDLGSFGRLEAIEQYFWADRGQPGFGSSQLAFAHSDDKRNVFSLRYLKKNLGIDGLDIAVTGFHRYDKSEFNDPRPRIGPPASSDTKTHAYGGDVRLDYFWKPFQLLTFAVETREDLADVQANSASSVTFQDFDVDRFTYAFVLKDEVRFFEDKVTLLPTIRFEDTTKSEGQWVPKFGVRIAPWKFLAFKGNIGRVFRVPNFDELYFPESEFIGGNPNLIPEKGYSADVGFEILTKPFFFSASLFYSRLKHAIFFVPISASRVEPVNFQDAAISQGAEVSTEITPIEYVTLSANYTYLDHYFETTGFLLPGRAHHDVNGRLTLKWPPWFRIYGEVKYLSSFPVVLAASGGQLEPARTVVNAGVAITPVEWVTLSFDAKDVNNARGINDNRDFPLPERRYFGTVALKF